MEGDGYVDAPEFFDGVKSDDFFEEFIPIIALSNVSLLYFYDCLVEIMTVKIPFHLVA